MVTTTLETFVITWHPVTGMGVRIPKALYDALVKFVVECMRENKNADLTTIMEKSKKAFPEVEAISWYTHHVFRELKEKGCVEISVEGRPVPGRRLSKEKCPAVLCA